jgi:hypothetical protein
MDSNFGPDETFDDLLDHQIARIKFVIRTEAQICICKLVHDKCRKCKLTARLEKLEKARGLK